MPPVVFSARGEKPGGRAAGTDGKFNPPGAAGAVPDIGRFRTVHIHARISVAAREMDSKEVRRFLPVVGSRAEGSGASDVQILTGHGVYGRGGSLIER